MQRKYKTLNFYNKSEIQERLQTYFKFMVVRHPLKRIASAYEDKFFKQGSSPVTFQLYNKKIQRKVIGSVPKKFRKSRVVTFEQFAKYLTMTDPSEYDSHWARYHDLCSPCDIHYDYIAKLETLDTDAPVIISHLKKSTAHASGLQVPSYNANHNETKDKPYKEYYKDINQTTLLKLQDIYSFDFKLFDYGRSII